ncbi:MAG: hypothetical protein ABR555_15785 [Pyrinomonadaceae bacterium]
MHRQEAVRAGAIELELAETVRRGLTLAHGKIQLETKAITQTA